MLCHCVTLIKRGFRAPTAGYFSFGKSNQNHLLHHNTLRVHCATHKTGEPQNSLHYVSLKQAAALIPVLLRCSLLWKSRGCIPDRITQMRERVIPFCHE